MSKRAMEDLKKMLCRELDEIAEKGELTAGALDTAHKLTDTIKNIDKICMLEEGGEYSQRRGYSREGGNSYEGGAGNSYGGGYSQRHYVRGHYSRRGYSRDDGREQMIGEMEELAAQADGEGREIIRRALEELKNA